MDLPTLILMRLLGDEKIEVSMTPLALMRAMETAVKYPKETPEIPMHTTRLTIDKY